MSYTHSGNVNHPKVVDILAFIINGPNYAGPTGDLPCHRYHVCLASTGYDMVERWGNDPLPDSVVTSNEKLSLGMSSTVCNIMSKFIVNMKSFWMVYGSSNGAQTWESLMLTSLSYEWLPYQAGSDVPYNALVLSYTIENVPLYAVMKESCDYSFGSYNPTTRKTEIEYYGVRHPVHVHILTFPPSPWP